jgi:hypothetical protein
MQKQPSNEKSLSQFQKFEILTIDRSNILNAPYNPRIIDPSAKAKLRKSLATDGLVETLVWNKRTGNLVSGHQRIALLDELEQSQDYALTVSAIDVTLKKEKQINVFLNNTKAQGSFELDALAMLLQESDFSFENAGFDKVDYTEITGLNYGEIKSFTEDSISKLNEVKAAREVMNAKVAAKDSVDFFLNIVFQSPSDVDKFLNYFGLPLAGRYVDGSMILGRLIPGEKEKPQTPAGALTLENSVLV